MKKSIAIIVLLCCLTLVAADIGEQIDYTSSSKERVAYRDDGQAVLKIKDIRHDPFVAIPGEYIDVYLKMENTGGAIVFPSFELDLPYPFSLDESTADYKNMPTIEPGEKITLQYKLKTDTNALPGNYEIKFFIKTGKTEYARYYFELNVDNVITDFDVALQEVNKDGAALAIANIGKNSANSITVSLKEQEDFTLLGVADYIIGNLNTGDYTILTTYLKPNENKEGQNLLVKIDYTDTIGNRRTIHKTVQITNTPKIQTGFKELEDEVLKVKEEDKGGNVYKYATIILFITLIALFFMKRRRK